MTHKSAVVVVDRFSTLRGPGPYDEATMMEAASLLEELLGLAFSEEELSTVNFGSAECLNRFLTRGFRP